MEGIRVVWISCDIEFAAIACYELIFPFPQFKWKMGIEPNHQIQKSAQEQFLPLLVKRGIGDAFSIKFEKLEKFVGCRAALH
jgi:hypothetical protein